MNNIFKNKNVLILGLGKSGSSSFEFLKNMGAFCYVYDKNKDILKYYEGKKKCNIVFEIGEEIIRLMDYCIISPGISIFDENVKLIKEAVENFDIKASGGIKTKEDFEKMIEAGATRIGTSNGKNLI